MEYIHVKNLEKYLPGYTDRTFAWIKLYFRDAKDTKNNTNHTGIFNDMEFQELDEIDRYRFISLACMEASSGKPVALTIRNMLWMGWNLKKRSKSKTLQVLQSFTDSVTETEIPVTQSRIEESRVDKSRIDKDNGLFLEFWSKYPKRYIPDSDSYVKTGKELAHQQFVKLNAAIQKICLSAVGQMKVGRAVPDAWRWLRDKKWKDYELVQEPPKLQPEPKKPIKVATLEERQKIKQKSDVERGK